MEMLERCQQGLTVMRPWIDSRGGVGQERPWR